MITTTLLIILGVLLVLVIGWMLRSPSEQRKSVEAAPAASQGIGSDGAGELFTARKGDVISVRAAAEDFSDLDFAVDRRSTYQAGSRLSVSLAGEFRGRAVSVEVQQPGPGSQILGFLDSRDRSLTDIGVTEDRLAELDQMQNPWQYIEFEGKRWQYESSRELRYSDEEQGTSEGLYRWLLKEQNGTRVLCVEKWEGEPFDVRIARQIDPEDINVYRAA